MENTFSFDDIKITLAEEYKQASAFYPGAVIEKKATVTVEQDSSPCYLYAMVENQFGDVATLDIDTALWVPVAQTEAPGKDIYRYREVVKRDDAPQALDVFKTVTFGDGITKANIDAYKGKTITVGAFAHQASGVNTETADANAVAYFTQPGEA